MKTAYEFPALHRIGGGMVRGDMVESIVGHVLFGVPVGDFLTSVFQNKLYESFAMADEINRANLIAFAYVKHDLIPYVFFLDSWKSESDETKDKVRRSFWYYLTRAYGYNDIALPNYDEFLERVGA